MATPQFSDTLTGALKNPTAWRFNLQLGTVFSPRFFCCTDPNELGIVDGKEPVAIILASAYSVGEGGSISFDGTDSYDPDGSIVAYSWSFSGGTPSSSSNSTETVTFNNPGKKRVRLTVTDGTGKRSVPAEVEIQVIAAGDGFGNQNEIGVIGGGVYAGTENGIYFSSNSGENWTNVSGNLSGDALKINDIFQWYSSYEKPQNQHILLVATDAGIYITVNGGEKWTPMTIEEPPNSWSDSLAPTATDLTFHKIECGNGYLFCIARWVNGGGLERSWIYYIDVTSGQSWDTLT